MRTFVCAPFILDPNVCHQLSSCCSLEKLHSSLLTRAAGRYGVVGTGPHQFSEDQLTLLTEAGAYPQLPTQPNFFDYFQTYTAI